MKKDLRSMPLEMISSLNHGLSIWRPQITWTGRTSVTTLSSTLKTVLPSLQIGALQLAEMLYRLDGIEPPHPEFFLSEEAIEKLRKLEQQEAATNKPQVGHK